MHEFEQYHESLVAFCKRLKISSGMADRAEITEGETHVEFLYNLLKREIELRDQAKIDGLIKDARFPVEYSFNQFRTDEVEFPEECTLDTLESLQFLREHKNVIMYGGTVFFASNNSKKLHPKMEKVASPFWRKLQAARQGCQSAAQTALQTYH